MKSEDLIDPETGIGCSITQQENGCFRLGPPTMQQEIINTSLEAYNRIVATGMVTKLQRTILSELSRCPGTSQEIAQRCGRQINSVNSRISELVRMGVVKRIDQRQCTVSGFTSNFWGLSGDMPSKPIVLNTKSEPALAMDQSEYWKATAESRLVELRRQAQIIEWLEAKLAKWGRPSDHKRIEKTLKDEGNLFAEK